MKCERSEIRWFNCCELKARLSRAFATFFWKESFFSVKIENLKAEERENIESLQVGGETWASECKLQIGELNHHIKLPLEYAQPAENNQQRERARDWNGIAVDDDRFQLKNVFLLVGLRRSHFWAISLFTVHFLRFHSNLSSSCVKKFNVWEDYSFPVAWSTTRDSTSRTIDESKRPQWHN